MDNIITLLNGSKEDIILALGIIETQELDVSHIFLVGKNTLQKYWFKSQQPSTLRKLGIDEVMTSHFLDVKVNDECYRSYNEISIVLDTLFLTEPETDWEIISI